jgi:cyclopropane fatty-acyl-phospholipid synthase-like methyltransferase
MNDIDWNEVWKSQLQRHRGCSKTRNWEWARAWESKEKAQGFLDMFPQNNERIEIALQGTSITPESRILDVGAGPGTLAVPFAKRVAHITAVEPAEGMVSVLRDQMAKHGIGNISVVQKLWEDVDINEDLQPPYDVVIASFSLDMLDIKSAISKIQDASSRFVYLYHFAGSNSGDLMLQELWPRLHGREYYPGPRTDVLYNVLYQMGIYPNISTFWLRIVQRFNSLQEALDRIRPQYEVRTSEQESIFSDYFSRVLQKENDRLVLTNYSLRARIWWEKEPGNGQIFSAQ